MISRTALKSLNGAWKHCKPAQFSTRCTFSKSKFINRFEKWSHFHPSRCSRTSCYSTAVKCEDIEEYDYIVVGAGSAGCVVARRLSAEGHSVILLEAGPKDNTWRVHMPAALMYLLFDPQFNWCYYTTPQKHMNNRSEYWPRGKLWGGSSSHNAMVHVRGHAYDFDRWESEGADGWSYADCLPYFKKSQTHQLGENEYRGGSGPLHVSRGIMIDENPLHNAFIEAGLQAGYPFTDDMNGYQQEGFGYMDMAIRNGIRSNNAKSYIHPVLYRSNLTTVNHAFVQSIKFDKDTAVGIEYKHRGLIHEVRANKEVILSGGAINSPQLLMLSGVGNADDLKKVGVTPHHHLPGVGENLQDHLELYIQHRCNQPITLYKYQWKFPHNMIKTGLEWFAFQTGSGATTHLEAGAFIRGCEDATHPDIQFHFLPSVVVDHGSGLGDCHAFQVHVGPMRPTSRGYMKLKSNNPDDHPIMEPNYLSTEQDVLEFRNCVKLTREIFAQEALQKFSDGELLPGDDIQSDEMIDAFVREKANSAYHPSCTCKIGQLSDPMAVVDSDCKVIGLNNLRVVDASVMPSVVSGNLNAAVTMLAEKAADTILGKHLPKSNAAVYSHTS